MSHVVYRHTQEIEPELVEVEDSGAAKIVDVSDNSDEGMFVRIQSWSDRGEHAVFDSIIGRQVQVTIEVLDD